MSEENQILFENYINDALSSEQKTAFDDRLLVDDAFREDFDLFKSMNSFLENRIEKIDALDALKVVADKERRKNTVKPTKKLFKYGAAASIALLVGVLSYFLIKPNTISYQDLYVEVNWPISKSEVGNKYLRAASVKIVEENYEEGIIILKNSDLELAERNYWIAEAFGLQAKADSVLHFLPAEFTNNERRDRLNYLQAISLFKLDRNDELNLFLQEIPEDTANSYLSIYKLLK